MGLKKQLGMGIASAVLGVSLISGGTIAYFSDTETTSNTFAAGTLDLSVNPSTIVDVDNLKPGDTVERDFELHNDGTLNINKVLLKTDYTVEDVKGDNNGADFGKYINVKFLYNADKFEEVVYETTLDKLKDMTPEAVGNEVFGEVLEDGGLEVGDEDDLVVQFEFVDNGEDQNVFQGDKLKLNWTFTAQQTDAAEK